MQLKSILRFALAATLLSTTASVGISAPAAPAGLFVGKQLNRHPLPRVERVPSTDGWVHWFKLEQAFVTLRPDGKFIASFKYYRQHLPPKASVRPGPMLNETYKGKYIIKGEKITFLPDPTKKHRKPEPLVGSVSKSALSIPYIVAEGQTSKPLRLDMKKESDW